jgi:hypothetical protein
MSLDFYKVMNYPIPSNKECFEAVDDIYSLTKKVTVVEPDFSKIDFQNNTILQNYIKKLNKY